MVSLKSFEKILKENGFNLKDRLDEYAHVFAHRKQVSNTEVYERLDEHIELVKVYALKIIEQHNLEEIINRIAGKLSGRNQTVGEYIKLLFIDAIVFHDFGKINDNFQAEKMLNRKYNYNDKIPYGTGHSKLSSLIYLTYHAINIWEGERIKSNEEKGLLTRIMFLFSQSIKKHHSAFVEVNEDKYSAEDIHIVKDFLDRYKINIEVHKMENLFSKLGKMGETPEKLFKAEGIEFQFAVIVLTRLNWSVLTSADYYATNHYMNNCIITEFGVLTAELKDRILRNINITKSYNKEILACPEKYLNQSEDEASTVSSYNLNILRQRLAAKVVHNIRKNFTKNLFYIEAPTGAGKTNLSILAASELLRLVQGLNKVFYVFPFITLVTQSYSTIKEIWGLPDDSITQLHSKAGATNFNNHQDEIDAQYGKQLKNYVDNIFANYPITLLTHIRFFDILKSNAKNSNYLLHRLANSIVIIDEIQAYNPKHWDKIKFFIENFSKLFNIKFIVMSATLPKIGDIKLDDERQDKFVQLIPKAQRVFFQNPNFCNRVDFRFDLLDDKQFSLEKLATHVHTSAEEYAQKRNDSYKGSVKAIVEFIYKRTTTEFYQVVKRSGLFDDYTVLILSGTILEPRRKEIINYLKEQPKVATKILLITTQVVEAGVDIDMDIGFKNVSLLDSDEQLAGRINRNQAKQGCSLWLFKYDDDTLLYGKDPRHKVARRMKRHEYMEILQMKSFDLLYKKVIDQIERINTQKANADMFSKYKNYFKQLDFKSIHSEFRLIENETISIFVPLDMPLHNDKFRFFTEGEEVFLRKYHCIDKGHVMGSAVWDLFARLVYERNVDFIAHAIQKKVLKGIMSKFIFSTYSSFFNKNNSAGSFFDYNEKENSFVLMGLYKINKNHVSSGEETSNKVFYNYYTGLNEQLLEENFEIL